jgi:hypothetical protein
MDTFTIQHNRKRLLARTTELQFAQNSSFNYFTGHTSNEECAE